MRHAAPDHHLTQDPTQPETLVPELLETLAKARATREDWRRRTGELLPYWAQYENQAMVDVTLALLLRHGLPIDVDAAAKAVSVAELACGITEIADPADDAGPGPDSGSKTQLEAVSVNWARSCADHIASIARSRRAAAPSSPTPVDPPA